MTCLGQRGKILQRYREQFQGCEGGRKETGSGRTAETIFIVCLRFQNVSYDSGEVGDVFFLYHNFHGFLHHWSKGFGSLSLFMKTIGKCHTFVACGASASI